MVTIRAATTADCRRWWEWRNDPAVCAGSFHPEPIPWEVHQQWFADKLADPGCCLFVVLDGVRPIGQLRFDFAADEAEAHITLAPEERGRGFAARALQAGCDALHGRFRRVVGRVRTDNVASIKAFERAGFVRTDQIVVAGQKAERMVLEAR